MISFSQIPGLEAIKTALINSCIDHRLPQTLLFIGPDGGSGLALAHALVQFIVCKHRKLTTSCGVCSSCKQFNSKNYSNLHSVVPVVKSGNAKKGKLDSRVHIEDFYDLTSKNPFPTIAEWHDVIESGNRQFSIPVSEAEYILQNIITKTHPEQPRFVIIWLPETFTTEAANKLLKTLEEPGFGNYFILVSNNPEKVLPTVLSRCISFRVPKNRDIDVFEFLTSRGLSESQSTAMALASNGNIGQSLSSLIRSEDIQLNTDMSIAWLRFIYSRKIERIMDWCENISSYNRIELLSFLLLFTNIIEKAFSMRIGNSTGNLKHESFSLELFAPFLRTEKGSEIVQDLQEATRDIKRNGNSKVIMLDLSFRFLKYIG